MSHCALPSCPHEALPPRARQLRRYLALDRQLLVYCPTCRMRIAGWLRWHEGRSLHEAIDWLERTPVPSRTCSWCGSSRGMFQDEDGDRICLHCRRLPGPRRTP